LLELFSFLTSSGTVLVLSVILVYFHVFTACCERVFTVDDMQAQKQKQAARKEVLASIKKACRACIDYNDL